MGLIPSWGTKTPYATWYGKKKKKKKNTRNPNKQKSWSQNIFPIKMTGHGKGKKDRRIYTK